MLRLLATCGLALILSFPVFGATRWKDEGTLQGYIGVIDCVGAGIACTKSGIKGTVTVGAGESTTAGRSLTLSTFDVSADSELYTDTKCIYWEDPVAADDFLSIWYAEKAVTITRLWCESDQYVNMTIQEDDGSPADIETTELQCDSTPADQTTGFEDAAIAAGSRIDTAVKDVSGTPTWCSFCFSITYDD